MFAIKCKVIIRCITYKKTIYTKYKQTYFIIRNHTQHNTNRFIQRRYGWFNWWTRYTTFGIDSDTPLFYLIGFFFFCKYIFFLSIYIYIKHKVHNFSNDKKQKEGWGEGATSPHRPKQRPQLSSHLSSGPCSHLSNILGHYPWNTQPSLARCQL